jgi:hypothetical protein
MFELRQIIIGLPLVFQIFPQLRGLENGELQQTPPDFVSRSSTISDEVHVSPSCLLIYQVKEQIFYLFVGSNDQGRLRVAFLSLLLLNITALKQELTLALL